jgi:uncharacterized LabA/DUF88 family protein
MPGVSRTPEEPPLSVVVLLDWQNIYNGARQAFDLYDGGHIAGNVDPLKLALGLAGAADPTDRRRELQEVRIYRGKPDNARDPRTYGAWRSQTSSWEQRGGDRLKLCSRDLKYEGGTREKGIDVWLAVDLARLAIKGSADRVVVFSTDTDLVPALELAIEERGEQFVEVAAWAGSPQAASCLRVPGQRILQRKLKRDAYDKLHDATDYNVPKARRSTPAQSWDAQIQAEGRVPRRRPPQS